MFIADQTITYIYKPNNTGILLLTQPLLNMLKAISFKYFNATTFFNL
jgi:hypothetical protein